MAKQKQPVLTVTIKGKDLEFRPPNIKRFSRYTTKLMRDERGAAARELLQTSCNLPPEEVQAIFDKAPAATRPVSDALIEMAIGDVEVDIVGDDENIVVKSEGLDVSFNGPNLEQWENFQSSLRDKNKRPYEVMVDLIYVLAPEDEKELGAFFATYPGTVLALYDAITTVAGGEVEVAIKKA